MEIWKNIDSFESYQVSSLGNVRNKKGNIMKTRVNGRGYVMLGLRNGASKQKIYNIHRLVAIAFIPKPIDKNQVNHIDGCTSNNIVSNLEWVTGSENMKHAYRMGLQTADIKRLAQYADNKKIAVSIVNKYTNQVVMCKGLNTAAKQAGVSTRTIRNIIAQKFANRNGWEVIANATH